jgi:hypothetical protein
MEVFMLNVWRNKPPDRPPRAIKMVINVRGVRKSNEFD